MLSPQARHDLESSTPILKCRHPVSPRINPRNPYTDGSLKQLHAAKAWPPTDKKVEQSWPRYALFGIEAQQLGSQYSGLIMVRDG